MATERPGCQITSTSAAEWYIRPNTRRGLFFFDVLQMVVMDVGENFSASLLVARRGRAANHG